MRNSEAKTTNYFQSRGDDQYITRPLKTLLGRTNITDRPYKLHFDCCCLFMSWLYNDDNTSYCMSVCHVRLLQRWYAPVFLLLWACCQSCWCMIIELGVLFHSNLMIIIVDCFCFARAMRKVRVTHQIFQPMLLKSCVQGVESYCCATRC